MENIFEIAAANQQRAREVIRDSRLEEAWRSVGAEPNLVGSLRTGLLMKHRDIDFHIYSSPKIPASAASNTATCSMHRTSASNGTPGTPMPTTGSGRST